MGSLPKCFIDDFYALLKKIRENVLRLKIKRQWQRQPHVETFDRSRRYCQMNEPKEEPRIIFLAVVSQFEMKNKRKEE